VGPLKGRCWGRGGKDFFFFWGGGGLIPYNLVVKNLLSPSSGLLTTNVSN